MHHPITMGIDMPPAEIRSPGGDAPGDASRIGLDGCPPTTICTGLPGRDLVLIQTLVYSLSELGRDDMSPQHQGKFIAYFRVSTDKQGKDTIAMGTGDLRI
jgi:hypothetical protein